MVERRGRDGVGVLSVWGGVGNLPAPVLHRGRTTSGGHRVPVMDKLTFAVSSLVHARRRRGHLVVVACHVHLAAVALVAARVARAPIAVWCHGDEVWGPLPGSLRFALQRADLVMAPSRFTCQQATRWAGLRREPVLVRHGLPAEFIQHDPPEPIPGRVLAVARLEPGDRYKGIDTLVRAWPIVLARRPDAELVVVGDGHDRGWLQGEVRSMNLTQHIRFEGSVDDSRLRDLYRTAEVFALPTRARVGVGAAGEGFGLVFVEAAAASLPAVAGRAGAVPEVVVDRETGLLVDPMEPRMVADAIGDLLADPELRRRLGTGARSNVLSRFSYESFRDRMGELLDGLAA
jgi:phosphatidyl-myo-inositol dimannoside synthase